MPEFSVNPYFENLLYLRGNYEEIVLEPVEEAYLNYGAEEYNYDDPNNIQFQDEQYLQYQASLQQQGMQPGFEGYINEEDQQNFRREDEEHKSVDGGQQGNLK